MKTEIFINSTGNAADIIKSGGIVAVPTETVYGLACSGLNDDAVRRIYEVKGRPEIKPLNLMVPDSSYIDRYCEDVPESAYVLADRFWPGPLTIILKSKPIVPSIVRAGGETVGLRCPDSPLTLRALKESDLPFAAPSANPSGLESATDADMVMEYFQDKIDAVIDGGPCSLGVASTIVTLAENPYRILREGVVTESDIMSALIDSMRIIGITGQSGAGKSTLLPVIEQHGGLVIDCDRLYHEMLENDSELNDALMTEFPDAFIEGRIDRRLLSSIVFSDGEKLKTLNSITHSLIGKRVTEMLGDFAMRGGRLAAVDAVELISSGLSDICDVIVGVCADESIRASRVSKRDSISFEEIHRRFSSQKSQEYYRENCDCVLENNGSEAEFINKFLREVELK